MRKAGWRVGEPDRGEKYGSINVAFQLLTDIYPEENGIFDFHRRPKFDTARIREIQQRVAAIEKEG